jgi:type IV secretory pathway VirD2 relaxase
VVLYAKMSRMRVLASPNVLASAERALQRILDTYSETDVTFTDVNLRTMVQHDSFDFLRDFSESCRAEFNLLRPKQL